MDRDELAEAAPHYLAIAILILLVIGVTRFAFGDMGLWIEAGIVIGLAVLYQNLLRHLGRAPRMWER